MKHEWFDVEGELDAGRSEPRAEFVTTLAGDVRGRVRRSRIGLMLALCGLMIVAVASFGGIGYAAGSEPSHNHSAAAAQYGPYTPPTPEQPPAVEQPPVVEQPPAVQQQPSTPQQAATFEPKATKVETKAAVKAEAVAAAPKAAPAQTSSRLPFTGLALWIPLAIGLVLIAAGVLLRTRARRQGPSAH